jgi:hypothetical protein
MIILIKYIFVKIDFFCAETAMREAMNRASHQATISPCPFSPWQLLPIFGSSPSALTEQIQ